MLSLDRIPGEGQLSRTTTAQKQPLYSSCICRTKLQPSYHSASRAGAETSPLPGCRVTLHPPPLPGGVESGLQPCWMVMRIPPLPPPPQLRTYGEPGLPPPSDGDEVPHHCQTTKKFIPHQVSAEAAWKIHTCNTNITLMHIYELQKNGSDDHHHM